MSVVIVLVVLLLLLMRAFILRRRRILRGLPVRGPWRRPQWSRRGRV